MTDSRDDRFCTHHPHSPAVAVCAECGGDVCGSCHGVDDRGFAVCRSCRGEEVSEQTDWEDEETPYGPRAFASTLIDLLRHPRAFFETLPKRGSPYPALAFGLVCLVVGMLVGRVWQFLLVEEFATQIASFASEQGMSPRAAQISIFVATPFIAVGAAALHLGLLKGTTSLFGADCSWSTATRIAGYALGASAWLLVPPVWGVPVGRFLMIVWIFNLEVTALRTYFDLGPWWSMFAALGPLLGLLVCGV